MTAELVPLPAGSSDSGAQLEAERFPTHVFEERIKIGGAKVDYQLTVPDYQIGLDPVAIADGYFGTHESYEQFAQELASRGVVVLTYDKAHSQDLRHTFSPQHLAHPERLGSQMLYGVMNDARQQIGYRGFHVVGHSEGGQNAVNAVLHDPEQARSVTLVGSAGLSGHNLLGIVLNGPNIIKKELWPLAVESIGNPKLALEISEYLLRNFGRTLAEGVAVANCNLLQKIQRLGALGIPVEALEFAQDQFFGLEEVEEHCADIIPIRVCANPEANHVWPQSHPRETVDEVFEMITGYPDKEAAKLSVA